MCRLGQGKKGCGTDWGERLFSKKKKKMGGNGGDLRGGPSISCHGCLGKVQL